MKALQMLPAATVFLAALAVPTGAQPPVPKTDSGCVTGPGGRVECRFTRAMHGFDSSFNKMRMRMDSTMMNRAVLGLELRPTGNKRDTLGVFVENVAPGGPAEKAGIVEGDRIASINGVDLRESSNDVGDPYTDGIAAHRLSREVQKLAPGARVSLRVYSGGRFRDVEVTAGRASDLMRGEAHFHGFPGMRRLDGPGGEIMPMLPEGMRLPIPPGGMAPTMPEGFRMEMATGGAGRGIEIRPRSGAHPGAPMMLRLRAPGRRGPELVRA